ncbi:MAG TPA: sugar phosphate nucleotidyltransferase [Dehalococcoidia bacterium]|nr:sugar phosphate nucleotidyltransferase [Dehalococcoidia bacterium]
MKVVILAGGLGTRLMEETETRPKPMVEIGGRPMLWHIMQLYAQQGFDDFIIAAGYKSEMIKRYFVDYSRLNSDLHIDFASGAVETRSGYDLDWRVQVVDTGSETPTGGRLQRLEPLLRHEGRFMLTYGDGLADVDIKSLVEFHERHDRLATLTAVRPPATPRLAIQDGRVRSVRDFDCSSWANGGFFVFEPGIFDYLDGDEMLEAGSLAPLSASGQLMAYRHEGFWQCMDTAAERDLLESYWRSGERPWTRSPGMNSQPQRSYLREKLAPAAVLAS